MASGIGDCVASGIGDSVASVIGQFSEGGLYE